MDGAAGPTVEHSDSDSGESWILLEPDRAPTHADYAPELPENNVNIERSLTENVDKDEDTDGISIISDSEPESITHCEWSSEKSLIQREVRPTEQQISQYVSDDPLHNNNDEPFESMKSEDDFLGDNHKLKTYVHHRNKRLSTVLNIIVLGSVITAAGVAIGHMWGMRDDCSMHSVPSVNKILSNLYKLQEENTYLRNVVRELTQNINGNKIQKQDSNEVPLKPYRCKKVFEEPLSSKNVKITKCVDNNNFGQAIERHLKEPEYEKDFLIDVNKLKHVYKENKSWLDKETIKRLKNEENFIGKKNIWKHNKFNKVNQRKDNIDLDENVKRANVALKSMATPDPNLHGNVFHNTKELNNLAFAEPLNKQHYEHYKRDEINDKKNEKDNKEYVNKMKPKKEKDSISEKSVSENEFKKDDRFIKHKQKLDRKKQDRQKLHKKQKRRNKYEQWEMKGGYLKDYDEILSLSSSQDSEYVLSNANNKKINQDDFNDIKETGDSIKSAEILEKKSSKHVTNNIGRGITHNDSNNWYEKRVNLRTEARKKLEYELFGENTTNSAGWYFRRMHRREQCRAKRDNSTQRKITRRNMNFKMKH